MGFYEDDRIRRKQRKFLLAQAEARIEKLIKEGISGARLLNLLQTKTTDTSINETEREIYATAVELMNAHDF